MNMIFKFLCSIPIILVTLYYIPFLGIILILFRYYVYSRKRYYSLPICLIVLGILITIPKLVKVLYNLLKINFNLSTINRIVESSIYIKLLSYSKLLITVGVILLILSIIFRNLIMKLLTSLQNYIHKYEKEQREIREKNDLIVKERREIANNTHLVHCPNCGADNTIVGKTGKCKFCRKEIEFKK